MKRSIENTVAILGAGPAGIAAAISVARSGGYAYLIEVAPRLGGSATSARVGTICGLSRCGTQVATPPDFDNPGFAREFSLRVASANNTRLVRNASGLSYLPYSPTSFKVVTDEYLSQYRSNVQVLLGEGIRTAKYERSDSFFRVALMKRDLVVGACIDCSGDAVLVRLLGLSYQQPNPYQAGALVFELGDVPNLEEAELAFLVRKILRQGYDAGAIPERQTYVSIVPGSLRGGVAAFKLGTEAPVPEDADHSPARIEERARTDIRDLVNYLRSAEQQLCSVHIRIIAPALGVRSGRRGSGKVVLSDQAVALSHSVADGVALGLWPSERWDTPVRPELSFPLHGCSYEIPLGALCSSELPGVYFAGRCISATDQAIASARVIGTCLSTGYAAGRAAVGYLRGEQAETIVSALRAEQVDPLYRLLE